MLLPTTYRRVDLGAVNPVARSSHVTTLRFEAFLADYGPIAD